MAIQRNENELASKIKTERMKKGIRQNELAKTIGISNSYLSDIEVGRTFPSLKVLVKIAKALRTNLPDFLSEFSTDNSN